MAFSWCFLALLALPILITANSDPRDDLRDDTKYDHDERRYNAVKYDDYEILLCGDATDVTSKAVKVSQFIYTMKGELKKSIADTDLCHSLHARLQHLNVKRAYQNILDAAPSLSPYSFQVSLSVARSCLVASQVVDLKVTTGRANLMMLHERFHVTFILA